ncbi:piggyBac transposable element-derived protein 4-like isoform X1 [Pecten maximus]|uniref:piggyBac transposable element-derived protein 4-like isoform X1 n=2 Tax=Pecten maximus TaxID=6579 RepID=UPI0014585D28|nr:piggyBac transposable element-derived protein 4-like isoform X1 [Pecten maximus]
MDAPNAMAVEVPSGENYDFDGYFEPYEGFDLGMSEEEEDFLDDIMTDPDYVQLDDDHIESADSQDSSFMGSQEPLGSICWQDETVDDEQCPDNKQTQFTPNLPPGVNTGRLRKNSLKTKTPMDFLRLFLTSQLITTLCIATNHFAESLVNKGKFTSYAQPDGTWCRVTEEEMYKFIGIIIYMSFTKMSTMDRYWASNYLYRFNPVPLLLPKRRFQSILAFLQIAPPADIDKSDKLTRITPLLDHVNAVSQELFQPFRQIAVDERMVASRHRFSGIRQFIKDKPVMFGLKLWILADTQTGYTYNFYVYLGKKRSEIIDKGKGLAYNVVFKLISPLLNQGYHLFVDNFYTSLNLIKDLLAKSTYLIGAVHKNSTAMPLCFKTSVDQWEKATSRGDFRWHRQDGYVTVQWKDCRTVTIVSPIHKGSDVTSCVRTVKHRTGFKKTNVSQPVVVNSYNQGMLGVDKSNQYVTQFLHI